MGSNLKYDIFSLSSFTFTTSIEYNLLNSYETFSKYLCTCVADSTAGEAKKVGHDAKNLNDRPKNMVRVTSANVGLESVGIFIGKHVVDILDDLLVHLHELPKSEDLVNDTRNSFPLGNSQTRRELKPQLKHAALNTRSLRNHKVSQVPVAALDLSTSSSSDNEDDNDGLGWECKKCSFFNSSSNQFCSVCKTTADSYDECRENCDELDIVTENTSRNTKKSSIPQECVLSNSMFFIPEDLTFEIRLFVLSVEGL